MRKKTRDPREKIPLLPAMFQVLLALADQERHGYAIKQAVELQTDGLIVLGPGTLYGTIKRLLAEDMIEESAERPDPEFDDERRRYYRLTDFGRGVARAEAERLNSLVLVARAKSLLFGPESR
jgi:DNA-binding PadR family transcriptional regulator